MIVWRYIRHYHRNKRESSPTPDIFQTHYRKSAYRDVVKLYFLFGGTIRKCGSFTYNLFTLHLLRELWEVISNREERRSHNHRLSRWLAQPYKGMLLAGLKAHRNI